MGINEAVSYVFIGRFWSIISGLVTIKLILLFMTPELQGYYYSINNLLQMQLFLELGLGIIIIHTASSEFAKLRWTPAMTLEGDDRAKQRLASLLRKMTWFYGLMGLLFLVIIVPSGIVVLNRGGLNYHTWLIPWLMIGLSAAIKLVFIPFNMIFAGAGKINIVSRYQTFANIIAIMGMWVGIAAGINLYSLILLAWLNLFLVNYNLLRKFWPTIKELFTLKIHHPINWKKEIWPYQSRSGFNIVADWVFLQSATPILLSNQGSVAAGKIGMTLSVVLVFTAIGTTWMMTRSVEFSKLLGLGKTQEVYDYYKSISYKSMPFVILGLTGVVVGIWMINRFDIPYLSDYKERVLPPYEALLLVLFVFSNFLFNNYRIFLRAYKKEPFYIVSLFLSVILITSNIYFSTYSMISMLLSQFILGTFFCAGLGTFYFQRTRKKWNLEIEEKLAEA